MGGSSTYGYETHDGCIHYCVYRDYVLLEDILSEFKNNNIYQINYNDGPLITTYSIEDYFSEELYKEEDTKVRGVYRFDGTFVYRFWGDKGYFIYKSNYL